MHQGLGRLTLVVLPALYARFGGPAPQQPAQPLAPEQPHVPLRQAAE